MMLWGSARGVVVAQGGGDCESHRSQHHHNDCHNEDQRLSSFHLSHVSKPPDRSVPHSIIHARRVVEHGLKDLWLQTASRAWSRSAMMSSAASIPTEKRIIPSEIPIWSRVSGSTLEWLVVTGCEAIDSVPPSEVANPTSLEWSRGSGRPPPDPLSPRT